MGRCCFRLFVFAALVRRNTATNTWSGEMIAASPQRVTSWSRQQARCCGIRKTRCGSPEEKQAFDRVFLFEPTLGSLPQESYAFLEVLMILRHICKRNGNKKTARVRSIFRNRCIAGERPNSKDGWIARQNAASLFLPCAKRQRHFCRV